MICPHCKAAGDLNARGDTYAAQQAHLRCADLNCACQHATGDRWLRA